MKRRHEKPMRRLATRDGVPKGWCKEHHAKLEGMTEAQKHAASLRLLKLLLDNPTFQRACGARPERGKPPRTDVSSRNYALSVVGAGCCLVGDVAMEGVYAAGRKAGQ